MDNIKNILVIKIGAIGDVLLTTPALRALRKHYPKSKITYLIGPKAAPVIENNPCIDKMIIFREKHYFPKITNLVRYALNPVIRNELKPQNFDLAVDFDSNYRSCYISVFAKAKKTIGFKLKGRRMYLNRFYDIRIKHPALPVYQSIRYLSLLKPLGIEENNLSLDFFPLCGSDNKIDEFFRENKLDGKFPIIGINPGTLADAKRWPAGSFIELIKLLNSKFNASVILTWGKVEKEQAEVIAKNSKCIMASNTNLNELGCLILRCHLFITNDTSPMHMAAALKIPTIGIFGPTDWRIWSNPNDKFIPVSTKVPCGPCSDFWCKKSKEKKDICIKNVTVDQVFEKAKELLKM